MTDAVEPLEPRRPQRPVQPEQPATAAPQPLGNGESPYLTVDYDGINWEEMNRKTLGDQRYDALAPTREQGRGRIEELLAIGGPFAGIKLNVRPGVSEVVLNAAFGNGDMHGNVIYRRHGTVMRYVGPVDQSEAIALELEGRRQAKLEIVRRGQS